jgi:2-oxoglutarate dehydrogenase complex dehydrogenase (E1) component-like enzyme
MEPNYSKIFNEKMMQTVSAFCSENEIKDIDGFILKCFKQGFDIKKYGFLEKTLNEDEKDLKTDVVEEKQLIKEVIVEKRVEVPVEIIKEVLIEKEIIKEVPVEKIVTIYDKSGENELGEKIVRLEDEMSKKDKELDELRRSLDEKLDNTNEKLLQETLQKLRKELTEKNEKIKELTKINQDLQNTRQNKLNAVFLRGSNINDTI